MTRPPPSHVLETLYRALLDAYGPQHWWPAKTPFEVIVGAILTQNTAWKNVTRSIGALRDARLLDLRSIHEADPERLAQLVRSSGYYNQKAKKLKAFCRHVVDRWEGRLDRFLNQEAAPLRGELLKIYGIGPETADSIVLYAAFKPSFVVDAYTHRVLHRHGLADEAYRYESLRARFMEHLEPDTRLFQEYHALLVRVGRLHCRKRPSCSSCPLQGLKPEDGNVKEKRHGQD